MAVQQLLLTLGAATVAPPIPPPNAIGDAYAGGYYAGDISYAGNGIATHRLVIAPAATGYNGGAGIQLKTSLTATTGTSSTVDGAANTAAMSLATHPAANYCVGLNVGGYADWYLPALYELEIAYYNLKPSTTQNGTSIGSNPYSVPTRTTLYTTSVPARVALAAFQTGGAEAFLAVDHWTSTQVTGAEANNHMLSFFAGGQTFTGKTSTSPKVRAFRKVAI